MKIKSTSQLQQQKLKILVYGQSGIGKTSLVKTITDKTLIISSEAGLLSCLGSDIDFIDISIDDNGNSISKECRIDRLLEVYKYLHTKEATDKYQWIYIDSLTEISENIIERLYFEFPNRKDSLVMFGENNKKLRSLVKAFRDLSYYHVVVTALLTPKTEDKTATIKVVGRLDDTIPQYFDEVFLMLSIDGERKLVTHSSSNFIAKDRSGKLDQIEEPNLQNIKNKILT